MKCAALVVGEIITFVIRQEVDNRPFGQGRRLVEDQASLLDMGSERAHVATVRLSERPASVHAADVHAVHDTLSASPRSQVAVHLAEQHPTTAL